MNSMRKWSFFQLSLLLFITDEPKIIKGVDGNILK
jgi:hypothetical protein